MAQAHSVNKNNYLKNSKDHAIFTPKPICNWLKEVLEPELENVETVFDPAVGGGNLLAPFQDMIKIGADITKFDLDPDIIFHEGDYLDWASGDYGEIDLVLTNPPFNHTDESRAKWGRSSLYPEMFADQTFRLFGKDTKMVLFTPMGLRLNTRCYTRKQGDRYKKMRDNWGQITSVCSMPLDVFHNPNFNPNYPEQIRNPNKFKKMFPKLKPDSPEVLADPIKHFLKSNLKRIETHQEILFFNMPEVAPHLSLPETVIEQLRDEDKEIWK
jgi:type I restriction enzyme M protein